MRLLDRGRTPRGWSLVGRLTGGVVLIALLSFAAQAMVLALWLVPVTDDLAGVGAEQATMVQAALAAVPPEQRAALARKLSSGWVSVSSRLPSDAGAIAPVPQRDLPVSEILRREIQVRFARRPGQRFAAIFRLRVDGQDWWMTRAYSALPGAVTGTIGIWLVVLGVATVGALLLSVRFIARPFARLATQISRQHGRLQPLPETGDASAELQSLVRAFNDLVRQVTAASEGRQQLLAGVSHDLRTPLTRLRLAIAMLPPDIADTDGMNDDVTEMERLIGLYLTFARGEGTEQPQPTDIALLIEDLAARAARGGAAIALDLAHLPQAVVRPEAMRRALSNLLDNAARHAHRIVVAAAPEGGQMLRIVIDDDGPGIPAERREQMLRPFESGSAAGTGLGLAIARDIVAAHGGTLRLDTSPLGGLRVAITIPL